MAPDREANIANSGKSIFYTISVCCVYPLEILMSTHNIQFHNEIRKPLIFVFLIYRKNFVGSQKLSMVNEPSVFELLRFDCSSFSTDRSKVVP